MNSMIANTQPAMPIEDQKALILFILSTFDDPDQLSDFIRHVGFDIGAMDDYRALTHIWLAHYRVRKGHYDVNRACRDLATWPPIAARIVELSRAESEVYPNDL